MAPPREGRAPSHGQAAGRDARRRSQSQLQPQPQPPAKPKPPQSQSRQSNSQRTAGRAQEPAWASAPADPAAEAGALAEAASALGLALDAQQQARLLAYCALLRKWNAVYNLTAIRDPGAMLVQHLFDCLAILPALRGAAGGPDRLAEGAVVLDVGSGGGLPGVVLAICAPQAAVHCVDTVGKKAAFLTQVRAELGLSNLSAHHARVEDLQAGRELPAATLIVSRAFSSLDQFVRLTAHLLAPTGVWAAMKGQWPEDELAGLPAGVRPGPAFTLAVPQLEARRHLLILEPSA